jgi:uncharacterized ferritin-like protein (DUF455 family)
MNIFDAACEALIERDPETKCAKTTALGKAFFGGGLDTGAPPAPPRPIPEPGHPEKPPLVSPQQVTHRGPGTLHGRAALIHALAHIEFNAINLALDATYRFRSMPAAFHADWLKVAGEEALHFTLLREHLQALGYEYGDFPAHNGLWDMAVRTAHDPLARMALVPRLLEARGLDVTPGIRAKLAAAGDHKAADILDIILRDEIGHVAIGNHWFGVLCAERGLTPAHAFKAILEEYRTPPTKPPYNRKARMAAGFSAQELAWLDASGTQGT